MFEITGKTRLFGCIADPVSHVRAPAVFNPLFREQGIDAVMVPLHVRAEALGAAIAGLRAMPNFGGMAITLPHKIEIMRHCDEIGPLGTLIGAVNFAAFTTAGDGAGDAAGGAGGATGGAVPRRLVADNCDGIGFRDGMLAAGYAVEGSAVLMIGAGGAARAIAFTLAEAGVARLTIANRTRSKAEALADGVRAAFPRVAVAAGAADPRGFDTVINTSALGLAEDDPLPLDPDLLEPGQLVAEIIMNPAETPILRHARARGCRIHYGRPMFDWQISHIAKLFGYDFPPPDAGPE